jgi:hypothetical protein
VFAADLLEVTFQVLPFYQRYASLNPVCARSARRRSCSSGST